MLTRRNLILGSGAAVAAGSVLSPVAAQAATSALAATSSIDLASKTILKTAPERRITVFNAQTERNLLAMTFDDGPHPRLTPMLLDMLKARDVRATFYVIGRNVARYPDIVKRMVDEGHEIGNHTWRHPLLSKLGPASVLRELDRTSEAVYKAVQRIPVTLRPPYGGLTRSQRAMVHDERDMPTILWSVDPEDWRRPGASVVASRIISHARPGSIVLSHDIQSGTVKAMPATLDALKDKGYRFETVSMILGQRDWSKLRWRLPSTVHAKS